MSDKLPQSTTTLVKRLRRVAKKLRPGGDPYVLQPILSKEQCRAFANTCDQAAGRLEDAKHDVDQCECFDCRGESA